jgi:tetratricopeptide (TPR) repeat protein
VHASAGWQALRLYRAYALLRLGRRDEAAKVAWAVRRESDSIATPTSYRFKGTLGRILEDLGQQDEAKKVYEEAIEECRARGNEFSLSVTLTYLGDLELELGNPDESLQHHFQALKYRRELKQNLGVATSLRGIGRALLEKGHANEAKLSLLESAQRFRDDNAVSGHASAQLLLAQAEFESGDRLLARRLAQNAVELLRGLSPSMRLTIGPWGEHIVEQGEELLRRIEGKQAA